MLTDAQLDDLLKRAVLDAQFALARMSRVGALAIGATLYCRVMWPRQHKSEIFLLLGPEAATVSNISGLSGPAAARLANGGFAAWWQLQDPHEQFAFMLRADIAIVKNASQTGIVLVH